MCRAAAYLGDSVYIDIDDLNRIILTTENGLPNDPSNRIVLEPEVAIALYVYLGKYIPPR